MKALLLVVLLAVAHVAYAAQGSAQIDAPRLLSITAVVVYDDEEKDKLASLNVTAKFSVQYLEPDGKKKRRVVTVGVDLIEAGTQIIEVKKVLYDYDELADALVAVVVKRYFELNPQQLPMRPVEGTDVRRRTLREKAAPK